MGLAQPKTKFRYTIAQYLAMERASAERHFYLDGEIYAMAGESPAHGDISANLVITLGNQVRGTPCRVRTKDTKVCSGPLLSAGETTRGLFSYPDLVVICGEPQYHDTLADVVLNPKVIIEVLSESTEAFDRGGKFRRFQRWNPTLTDYLLVSQDQPLVEHFTRQPDGTWSYRLTMGLDSSVVITSISCTLKLAEVYERITFAEGQPE